MNLAMQIMLGGLRKKPNPVTPTAITFQSLTANGADGIATSNQLTATFSEDPGLNTNHFSVNGASKGVVSKVDNVYTINIHTLTVENLESVTLQLTNPPGVSISPLSRSVVVYKASDVEGEGTVYPDMGQTYKGYRHIDINGLVIDDIVMLETTNTTPRQMTFSVRDQVRFTGSRTLTDNPVIPYQDFQTTWEITYDNGDPIPDEDGITVFGNAFNPFIDQRKGQTTVIIRRDRGVKAKAIVTAQNGEGFVRVAEFEKIYPATPNTLPIRWADYLNGNSANDGLDAWGLALSATYNNATKRLFQVGKFANYDQAAATADPRITYKYDGLYLTGASEGGFPAGYYRGTKIDDDTFELFDALGADYTNVTSSTGPKAAAGTLNNTQWMVANGDVDYGSAILMYQTGRLMGYGATKPRIINSSETPTNLFRQSPSGSGAAPVNHQFMVGNMVIDGEYKHTLFGFALNTTGGRTLNFVFDDVDRIRSPGGAGVNLSSTETSVNIKRNILFYGGYNDNLNKNRREGISAGNLSGSMTFVFEGDLDEDTPDSGEILYLNNNGRKPYSTSPGNSRVYYSSRVGNVCNLTAPLPDSCAAGNACATSDVNTRTFGLFVSSKIPGWRTIVLFNKFDGDGYVVDKDHHIYADGYLDDLDISYNHFGKGIGCTFAVNASYSSNVQGYVHRGYTFVGNECDDGTRLGTDMSKTNNSTDVEGSADNCIAENRFKTLQSPIYYASAYNFRASHNIDTNIHGDRYGGRGWEFVHRFSSTDTDKFGAVIDSNVINDRRLLKATGNEVGFEVVNNSASVLGNNPLLRLGDSPVAMGTVIDFNNLFAPERTNGHIAEYGSTGKTIEQLNTDFNAVNTSDSPIGQTQFSYDFSSESVGSGLPSFIRLAAGSAAVTSSIIETTLSDGEVGRAWRVHPTVNASWIGLILNEIAKQTGDVSMFAIKKGEVGGTNAIITRLATRIKEIEEGQESLALIAAGHRPSQSQVRIRALGASIDVNTSSINDTTWFANWRKVLVTHSADGFISLYEWDASGTKPETPNLIFDDTTLNSLADAFVGVGGANDGRVIFERITVGINGSPAIET